MFADLERRSYLPIYLVVGQLKQDPQSGHLFLFSNNQTPQRCSIKSVPTPIRRPQDRSTNKAVCDASCAAGRSTTSTGMSDTAGAVHARPSDEPRLSSPSRFEYLFSEDSDNPCWRQYSVRFSPLRSKAATGSATSARLRRC